MKTREWAEVELDLWICCERKTAELSGLEPVSLMTRKVRLDSLDMLNTDGSG